MTIKKILIAIGILAIVIVAGFLFNGYKDRQTEKEIKKRVLLEDFVKKKGAEHIAIQKEIDSMKVEKKILVAIIEHQKNNPQIIIQKYEIEHKNIDNLTPSQSFDLFTSNLNYYKSHRGHYSLERFKRRN